MRLIPSSMATDTSKKYYPSCAELMIINNQWHFDVARFEWDGSVWVIMDIKGDTIGAGTASIPAVCSVPLWEV